MTTPSKCSCILCRKELSNLGLPGHISMVHLGNRNFQLAGNAAVRGSVGWKSGVATPDSQKKKISKALLGVACTEERKKAIREGAKRNGKSGGFREGGGRGKKGKYAGIHCDSSWELAFLIWALDNGKRVTRITAPRVYQFEGRTRKYFPDFDVDGIIYEIKGWKTPQWEAKHEQHPDVQVLGFSEIQPMLDYARHKFGPDFTVAYENMEGCQSG